MKNFKMITPKTTYDELDELMEEFRKKGVVAGEYMPTAEEVANEIEPNFSKYIDFIYWLLETSTPTTEEDKDTKRWLMSIFSDRVNISSDDIPPFIIFVPKKIIKQFHLFLKEIQKK